MTEQAPKKTRNRSALSASLLSQIASQVGIEAAKTACEKNDAGVVSNALRQLHTKDPELALQLGFSPSHTSRVADSGKVNRANAAIVNVSHLGLKEGDTVQIDRSVSGVITLKSA